MYDFKAELDALGIADSLEALEAHPLGEQIITALDRLRDMIKDLTRTGQRLRDEVARTDGRLAESALITVNALGELQDTAHRYDQLCGQIATMQESLRMMAHAYRRVRQ